MLTFLILASSKEKQEKELTKLLTPLDVDPIDIARISPQHSIGIGEVRELKRIISLKPYRGLTKAVVIEEAQTLTIEAQNALLKTLEEPPSNTIIVLFVSTNIEVLLPTVVSRCQVIQPPSTNSSQLTKDELEGMSQQLEVISGGIGERLKLAQDLCKDRETAITWLKNTILAVRQKLIDEVLRNDHSHLISQYLTILTSLQNTYAVLSTTNINPRFTLETLFLSLENANPARQKGML